jgi:hypothetical protein
MIVLREQAPPRGGDDALDLSALDAIPPHDRVHDRIAQHLLDWRLHAGLGVVALQLHRL